jgi:hypothetical protein
MAKAKQPHGPPMTLGNMPSRAHCSNALTSAFGWLRTEDQEGECQCQYDQCG